ncbi:hypothetical protein JCM13210_12170 [Thermaerobacter litoralis]
MGRSESLPMRMPTLGADGSGVAGDAALTVGAAAGLAVALTGATSSGLSLGPKVRRAAGAPSGLQGGSPRAAGRGPGKGGNVRKPSDILSVPLRFHWVNFRMSIPMFRIKHSDFGCSA